MNAAVKGFNFEAAGLSFEAAVWNFADGGFNFGSPVRNCAGGVRKCASGLPDSYRDVPIFDGAVREAGRMVRNSAHGVQSIKGFGNIFQRNWQMSSAIPLIAIDAHWKKTFGMDEKDSPEEIMMELEGLLREAQDEQADIQRVAHAVAKAMTESAFNEFPALKNMSAEQIRKFGDDVSRLSTDFAMRAANLAYAAEES